MFVTNKPILTATFLMRGSEPYTLPEGTRVQKKGPETFVVASVKLLQDLSGNKHDSKYRYLFIDSVDVKEI
jgi:hypothetical protein